MAQIKGSMKSDEEYFKNLALICEQEYPCGKVFANSMEWRGGIDSHEGLEMNGYQVT